MVTHLSDNNMLAFAIVNSNILDVSNIINNGLSWPSEPVQCLKYIENIYLPIQKGGRLPSSGVFYYPSVNDGKLIFTSNMSDGWDSLLYCLTKNNSNSSYLLFRILQGEYPLMEMSFVEYGNIVRLVRVIKENKWEFYEEGTPLLFEQKESYVKRRISDRLTYELLLSYSIKNGVDFTSPDFFRTQKESLWINEVR